MLVVESKIKVAQAELEKAEALVQFATVRAPFDGVITKRWIDAGVTVKDATMPLLTLMRIDRVRVLLDIPERDVPYITTAKGKANPVTLQFPALQEILAGQPFQGCITLLASALDPTTRTMRVEVHLDNRLGDRGNLLRPQMTGTATVVLAERTGITVPASSLVRVGNKVEIYVIAEPTGQPPRGVVKRVEVQLGLDDGLRVEIRNSRLTGKELVIAKGAGVIRPGDEVLALPARSSTVSNGAGNSPGRNGS